MPEFSLRHIVREPQEETPGMPAPLLLLLHGVGSNEQDLMGLAPALDPRFFVVSARAPLVLGHASYGWFHVEFTPAGPIIQPGEADASRELLLRFVRELPASYNVNPAQVYLMGFSQGCIMSLYAALTEPRLFAGVVGLSGRLLPEAIPKIAPPEQLRGLPLMIAHGLSDNVLGIEYGRAIRDHLQNLPVELTYSEYPIGHYVTPEEMREIDEWLRTRLDAPVDWRAAAEPDS